jgi:hypothetical protein
MVTVEYWCAIFDTFNNTASSICIDLRCKQMLNISTMKINQHTPADRMTVQSSAESRALAKQFLACRPKDKVRSLPYYMSKK